MRRVLFLVCGAGLLLIAGGRFLILLGDYALQPDSSRATAQIQFTTGFPLPNLSGGLSANLLSSLAKSTKFVEQLASKKHHTAKLTEAEAIQWLQRNTTIQHDPTHHSILLTYHGDVPENTVSVMHILARALAEQNSPAATVLPAAEAQVNHPPLAGFFKSPHVFIPLLATLASVVIFFLGWRMPTTPVGNSVSPLVVDAKY